MSCSRLASRGNQNKQNTAKTECQTKLDRFLSDLWNVLTEFKSESLTVKFCLSNYHVPVTQAMLNI